MTEEQQSLPVAQPDSPTKSLVGKLAEAFAAVGGLEKKGHNSAQNYPYLKAADVAKAVRMKLFERGIIMLSDVENSHYESFQTMKGSRMTVCRLTVRFTFHDAESTETVSFRGSSEAFDSGDKASYKAITGALKYALRTAGLIPDEKDDPEGDERVDREMAEDAADTAERVHLAKFEDREKKQPPPEPPQRTVTHEGKGWVIVTKVEELKSKNGPYWLMSVETQGVASKVSVWDKALRTPELWASSGKDCKISVTEQRKGDKVYYSLKGVEWIGSKQMQAEPIPFEPTDEEVPF